MRYNGVVVQSLEHLKSLTADLLEESKDAVIADYLRSPGLSTSEQVEISKSKVDRMIAFNESIKRELIAENIVLGITAIKNGRDKADYAFGPVFNEIDKCKYPEALREMAILKATTAKHFANIVTPERIQKYYDKILLFLKNL